MSQNRTTSRFEESALRIEPLSLLGGISLIVGANIGAGILSLAFGARQAGWPVLVFWIIVAGAFTTISMLYVAETSLRTKTPMQLSGLAQTYVGQTGSWLVFAAVLINSLGALIAYTAGSGDIIGNFLGIPNALGSLIFFVPAMLVVWLGLRVTGASEAIITSGMLLLVFILVAATIIGPGIEGRYLATVNLGFAIPVFSLAIFAFLAQYTVPELARGFAAGDARNLPRAIIAGMSITGILLIIVPGVALGLTGPNDVTEVVTVAWGQALGPWAFVLGNIFALLAFITSFWAIGESALTNVVDRLKFPSEWDTKYRLIAISIIGIPPFILAYSGLVGFVDALGFAGAFGGMIMAIIPVMMVNRARRTGNREPEWTCGVLAHPLIQGTLISLFVGAALYAILSILNVLPSGW